MVSTAADYGSGPRHPQLCSLPVLVGLPALPYRYGMAGAVKSLEQLSAKGADLIVRCRACGHDRTVPIEQALAIFHRRGWPTDWERVAVRFRCRTCGGKQVQLGASFYAHALRHQQVRAAYALVAVPEQLRPGCGRRRLASRLLNGTGRVRLNARRWSSGRGRSGRLLLG